LAGYLEKSYPFFRHKREESSETAVAMGNRTGREKEGPQSRDVEGCRLYHGVGNENRRRSIIRQRFGMGGWRRRSQRNRELFRTRRGRLILLLTSSLKDRLQKKTHPLLDREGGL